MEASFSASSQGCMIPASLRVQASVLRLSSASFSGTAAKSGPKPRPESGRRSSSLFRKFPHSIHFIWRFFMSQQLTHTVGSLLDDMARRYPDNEALVYPERGLRYSYKQFNDICRQIAKELLRLGIKKGDNIAIWAYNVPEWVLLQFASAKIGAILVTVNTSYKSVEQIGRASCRERV